MTKGKSFSFFVTVSLFWKSPLVKKSSTNGRWANYAWSEAINWWFSKNTNNVSNKAKKQQISESLICANIFWSCDKIIFGSTVYHLKFRNQSSWLWLMHATTANVDVYNNKNRTNDSMFRYTDCNCIQYVASIDHIHWN